jgi:hypothetical protein
LQDVFEFRKRKVDERGATLAARDKVGELAVRGNIDLEWLPLGGLCPALAAGGSQNERQATEAGQERAKTDGHIPLVSVTRAYTRCGGSGFTFDTVPGKS